MWVDFHVRDNRRWTFTLEEALLCFLQTRSFCLLKMLTDGLEWCGSLVDYCDVFISCLDSHSDGTHSLQRIHCWDTDAMLHSPNLFPWRNKLIYILDRLRVCQYSANFHFWVNYSFNSCISSIIVKSLSWLAQILRTHSYWLKNITGMSSQSMFMMNTQRHPQKNAKSTIIFLDSSSLFNGDLHS